MQSSSTTVDVFGELRLTQADGGLPATLASGAGPGECGVSVLSTRFQGGVHLKAQPRQHFAFFLLTDLAIDCRIGRQTLRHCAPAGSLAVCPAGIDCTAAAGGSVDALLVAVDPAQLALTAAEDSALEARLMNRLSGNDGGLLALARTLASECRDGFLNGPLFWNDAASAFIQGLVARHTLEPQGRSRGGISEAKLKQLKDYVLAHLDESINVTTLAKIAGRSQFHFSRVFTQSVGVTPHRYVVRLRLQRAIELVRTGSSDLAEIAACTGFADQSHLSRWVRRVHGVSLTQFRA